MLLPCQVLYTFNHNVAVNKNAVPTTIITVPQKTPTLSYSNPSNTGTPQLYWPTGPPPLSRYSALSAQTSSTSLQHTPWYNFQIKKTCKNVSTCVQLHSSASALYQSPEFCQNPNHASACLPPPQIAFPGLNNTPNTSVIPA